MPKARHIPKCKWCQEQVGLNYSNGIFKGYLRTCGSVACLKAAYKDKAINQKKRFHEIRTCEECSAEFDAKSRLARWCKPCTPDKQNQTRIRRYGVDRNWWGETFSRQNGLCAMCKRKPAICIDHNHSDGKVRGILCAGCNYGLSFIENKNFKDLAEKYLLAMENSDVQVS